MGVLDAKCWYEFIFLIIESLVHILNTWDLDIQYIDDTWNSTKPYSVVWDNWDLNA